MELSPPTLVALLLICVIAAFLLGMLAEHESAKTMEESNAWLSRIRSKLGLEDE